MAHIAAQAYVHREVRVHIHCQAQPVSSCGPSARWVRTLAQLEVDSHVDEVIRLCRELVEVSARVPTRQQREGRLTRMRLTLDVRLHRQSDKLQPYVCERGVRGEETCTPQSVSASQPRRPARRRTCVDHIGHENVDHGFRSRNVRSGRPA